MQLLIKGARVVDPSRNIDGRMDILINDGRIAQLGDNLDSPGARVLDASGLVAAPYQVYKYMSLRAILIQTTTRIDFFFLLKKKKLN